MSDTIREFLVKIGYQEQGRKEFSAGLGDVTKQAVELGAQIKAAALAVQGAVALIANNLEQLYFVAQRTGAAAESIQAIGYAASRVGSSVDAARGSIENLGRFLWSNPGSENFIQQLGVQTRNANGQLRDTGQVMTDLVRRIRQEQPALQMAYARIFGLDENIIRADGADMDKQQARYEAMQRAAHYNVTQAAKDSHFFMNELGALGGAIGILQQKVSSAFSREIGEEINRFTIWLVDNFDKIANAIEWAARKVVEAGHIVTDFARFLWSLVGQMRDAWNTMDADSKQFLEMLAAMGLAVLAFDRLMSMSLLGRLLLLTLGLAALYQEYTAWQAGAKSIIPWEDWEPEIKLALHGLGQIKTAMVELYKAVRDDLLPALKDLFGGKGMSGHDFLRDQISKTARDLKAFITEITDLVHIGAAVARGDWIEAWELIKKYNAPPDPGVSPREGALGGPMGGVRERDAQGDLLRQPGEDDATFFRRRGRDRWSQGVPLAGTADAVRSLLSRMGVRFGPGAEGGGGVSSRPDAPEMSRRMKAAYDQLTKEHGRSPEDAIALIANFKEESGFNLGSEGDPRVPGGSGGIGQWNRGRRDNFRRLYGHDVTQGTLHEQVEFANWELEHTHTHVRDALARAQGLRAKSDVVLEQYEVPSQENQDKRRGGGTAEQLRPLLDDRPVVGPGGIARPRIGAVQPERRMGDEPPTDDELERRRRAARGLPLTPAPAPPAPLGSVGPQSFYDNDNSRRVAMNQVNNITVHANADDGWGIGRSVMDAQRNMAAQTVRDLGARVS